MLDNFSNIKKSLSAALKFPELYYFPMQKAFGSPQAVFAINKLNDCPFVAQRIEDLETLRFLCKGSQKTMGKQVEINSLSNVLSIKTLVKPFEVSLGEPVTLDIKYEVPESYIDLSNLFKLPAISSVHFTESVFGESIDSRVLVLFNDNPSLIRGSYLVDSHWRKDSWGLSNGYWYSKSEDTIVVAKESPPIEIPFNELKAENSINVLGTINNLSEVWLYSQFTVPKKGIVEFQTDTLTEPICISNTELKNLDAFFNSKSPIEASLNVEYQVYLFTQAEVMVFIPRIVHFDNDTNF